VTGKPSTAIWDLPLDEADLNWALVKMQSLPKPWVAIHPHSSKDERNWMPERWAEVVKQAVASWNCGVVFTGGNSATELTLCEHLAQLVPGNTLNLCGQTTPKQLAALLCLADVLVAPDTGAVHIARAVKTQVIGLYAVASPKLSGPYQQLEYCVDRYPQAVKKYLGKDSDHLPWNTRVHHADAMALIDVTDVMSQLEKVLVHQKLSEKFHWPVIPPFASVANC
jgi:heptosyltransferase I